MKQTQKNRRRLANAIVEIMTNKTTPAELFNPVGDFVVSVATPLFHEMQKDPVFIEQALRMEAKRG